MTACVLRLARLEELGHARQTAGDVARLARLAADLRQNLALADRLSLAHDAASSRSAAGSCAICVPVPVDDLDVRLQALLAVLDDDRDALAARLVDLVAEGDLLLDVDEVDDSLLPA